MPKKLTPVSNDIKALLNVDARDTVTNQEAVPVPWHCGVRMLPLQWVMEPVNQFTAPSPLDGFKSK